MEDAEDGPQVYVEIKTKINSNLRHSVECRKLENKRRVFCQINGSYSTFFSGSTTRCIGHLQNKHNIAVKEEIEDKNAHVLKNCSKEDAYSLTTILVMFKKQQLILFYSSVNVLNQMTSIDSGYKVSVNL